MSSIQRLDEAVVNRIAAGEVIQRPANAVKELIENSLDAGSTSIVVAVKNGGLKFLQITDNGHGIFCKDMEIVCERFTTSKLQEFDDLKSISTFGFRGEALASISHVAHLSIISKTKCSKCAYKASYLDGKLKSQPTPIAGNIGTQITAEDLFYNVPTRRNSFKSGAEELQKIATVLTRYAVHNTGVAFYLKRLDRDSGVGHGMVMQTQANWDHITNIGALFGSHISKELIKVESEYEKLKMKCFGYITNANVSLKKFTFLLFINNRLVECTSLKRSLDALYQTYLPKGGCPFVYLSVQLNPNYLDVNVHPTKHEVHFLHEEQIVEQVQNMVEQKLLSCDSSRTFYIQKLLPQASSSTLYGGRDREGGDQQQQRTYDHNLVRTDSREQTLDQLLSPKHVTATSSSRAKEKDGDKLTAAGLPRKRAIRLTSVQQLRADIDGEACDELTRVVRDHKFVGCIDFGRALVQHSTELYLVDFHRLSAEMFYQIIITDFGNFGSLRLSEAAPIGELASLGLDLKEAGWCPGDGTKEELSEFIVNFLNDKAEMLKDYFSLVIENGKIVSIPMLLNDYIPPLHGLTIFILRISTEVCWEDEKEFFHSFSRELARFYSIREEFLEEDEKEQWKQKVEISLFPAFRKHLIPTSSMLKNETFLQLANLHQLYKVFERC